MREHHTKTKGDLGVLKAQVSLAEQGWLPLLPLTEHSAFDLVAYKDNQFRRIQVKYRKVFRGGLTVPFRSCWADQNGLHVKEIDKDVVDLFCIYCPELDECFWLDPKDFGKSVTLRVEAPKNNQTHNIKLVEDYRRVP